MGGCNVQYNLNHVYEAWCNTIYTILPQHDSTCRENSYILLMICLTFWCYAIKLWTPREKSYLFYLSIALVPHSLRERGWVAWWAKASGFGPSVSAARVRLLARLVTQWERRRSPIKPSCAIWPKLLWRPWNHFIFFSPGTSSKAMATTSKLKA